MSLVVPAEKTDVVQGETDRVERILVVDDDVRLRTLLQRFLEDKGFVVKTAHDATQMDRLLQRELFSLIVLDFMLPVEDGLSICRRLRSSNIDTPIIMLTARGSDSDRIAGLEAGADDYLPKPFYLPELNARIKALIRRNNFDGVDTIVINEITLYPEERKVLIKNAPVNLTAKEFDLLVYFIANKNRVVQKNALVEHLWGDNADQFDNFDFIYNHVKNLRKKLLAANCHDYLQSIYGIGYNFKTEL